MSKQHPASRKRSFSGALPHVTLFLALKADDASAIALVVIRQKNRCRFCIVTTRSGRIYV